jgi:hypothetical protein
MNFFSYFDIRFFTPFALRHTPYAFSRAPVSYSFLIPHSKFHIQKSPHPLAMALLNPPAEPLPLAELPLHPPGHSPLRDGVEPEVVC